MEEYEVFLKRALELKDRHNSVNCMQIVPNDLLTLEKLKQEGLISDFRRIGMNNVGFNLTYDGLHYFDEQE